MSAVDAFCYDDDLDGVEQLEFEADFAESPARAAIQAPRAAPRSQLPQQPPEEGATAAAEPRTLDERVDVAAVAAVDYDDDGVDQLEFEDDEF